MRFIRSNKGRLADDDFAYATKKYGNKKSCWGHDKLLALQIHAEPCIKLGINRQTFKI